MYYHRDMASKDKRSQIMIVRAVSAFSKKLSRFTAANPNGEPSTPMRPDEIRQKKVDISEEAFRLSVAENYRKYRFPYKTLGENSETADALNTDEQRLLAAYNLFKAILAANEAFSKYETFIRDNVIATPLVDMEQYTTGDEFIYLQSWLYFEQKAKDYIPYLSIKPDGSYILKFIPTADYRWNYRAKEVFAIIHSVFYPTEK